MPLNIPLIRIFLSSPGDVAEERRLAQQVINELPNQPVFRNKVKLAVIAWDDLASSTPMEASLSPQAAINKGLPQPSECDITITIFWSRLGTPFIDKHDGQVYQSGTHWELLNAINSPSRTLIYRRNQKPDLGDPDDPKFRAKLDQYDRLKAFLSSDLFYKDEQILRSVVEYDCPSSFEKRLAYDLQSLLLDMGILDGTGKVTPVITPADLPQTPNIRMAETIAWDKSKSPFPGLSAFTEADAPIFFGRGRETDALVQLVKQHRFVAVVGASGSGKSSLVGAGLMPRLRDNAIADASTGSKGWHILRLKPDVNPFVGLYDALIDSFPSLKPNPLEAHRIKENFLATMRDVPENFLDICQAALEGSPEWAEVLLFIDQFEELLTITHNDLRLPFAKLLTAIAHSQRVRAVVTMRHDFYPKAIEIPELATLLNTSLNLPAPKRDALREMIERPAERAELVLEPQLVGRILDDTGDEPGNLALMAYALDELYKLDDDHHLSHAEYDQLGGVKGAIGSRAESQFLALGIDESVLLQVFQALVEVDDRGIATRNRAEFRPDDASDDVLKLIEAFTQARLLTADYDETTGTATIEVAHEAILRQWERLANWIEATQDDHRTISRTKRDARYWDERGRPDFLRPNAESLKQFTDACERLVAKIDDPLVIEFTEPEQERLYRELEDINTPHRRRFDIGERLARIGDTRSGIGLLPNGLPNFAWLPVKGSNGKFNFEFGTFEIKPFYIAKYLTTYVQFQAFVDSGTYDDPLWWTDFPKEYQRQAIRNVTNANANAPRDTVSWYQAVAFTRWLTAQMNGLELPHPIENNKWVIGKSAVIRLPAEWEWQWAAQNGAEARKFPWGSWDKYPRANTNEAKINSRSTAIGMYPDGAAVCGALDISGNLQEWCLNKYDPSESTKVDNNGNSRVMRGGSFDLNPNLAVCAYRDHPLPYSVNYYFGVRVVVAAPI